MQPDVRVRESLRFGFEREGVAVTAVAATDELDPAPFAEPAEVVIAGGRSAEEASAVLAKVRGALVWCGREVPILYVGNGIARPQAIDQGAAEFLGQPAYVRDAVTVARLLAGRKRENPAVLAGDLAEHFGFYYLVRALSAVKRTGVLTLVRGMRRGELRFYEGEVTSAQAGLLHGLAAFHQLLLWTEGRFELRPEDVVRRQQIPLAPDELFADAERFLAEMIAVGGQLSPAAIYEREEKQIARMAGSVPDAVDAVLRLFDGHRTVADVVEDCTFRVFETLRLGNRMCELGLIRLKQAPRTRHPSHAALAIDEWLVGQKAQPAPQPVKPAPRHVVIRKADPIGPPAGQPASPPGLATREEGGRRKRRRRGAASSQPPPGAHSAPALEPLVIDWKGLLPQAVGGDVGVSQVVPSSVAAGEIDSGPSVRTVPARERDQIKPDDPVGPAYPGQVLGDLRARREREAPPVVAPARERIEEVAPAADLVQLFTAEPPTVPAPPADPPAASPPPRMVAAPTPLASLDQEATTEPLERVELHEASGTIEVSGPPPSAAGTIEAAPVRQPAEQSVAVPSVVIDVGSAPAAPALPPAPVALFDPPAVRRMTPPPIPPASGEEHAISVARKAIAEQQPARPEPPKPATGGPTHPRKPTPQPVAKRSQTKPPIPTGSFSDAEEAFFAQGSNMAHGEQAEAESFDDLDEGMNLPNTFWKRLFRSPTSAAARASGPPLKKQPPAPAPRRPASQPGRTATPPPRRPGPGARKK